MKRRIGTITLQTKTTFRYAGYECAAWWRETECNPQTVELFHDNHLSSGEVVFTFAGTRINEYFGHAARDIGKDDTHSISRYAYNFLALLHDRNYRVVLDEGVTVSAECKVLGEREKGWAHTAVFARIGLPDVA